MVEDEGEGLHKVAVGDAIGKRVVVASLVITLLVVAMPKKVIERVEIDNQR